MIAFWTTNIMSILMETIHPVQLLQINIIIINRKKLVIGPSSFIIIQALPLCQDVILISSELPFWLPQGAKVYTPLLI
jgi:hypothetical protein